MAEADPLLDEDLTREDRQTVAEIEGNQPQSGEGPEPVDLDEINPAPPVAPPLDLTPPEIGSEGPTRQEPIPGMPTPVPAAPVETPMSEDIARRQGEQDKANAAINAATAQRMANEAQAADEEARLERADYLQRRQDAEKDLDARIKQYEQARLVNPREHVSTKSRLAVIFGGLGAALRSAGGGSSENRALDQLQKQWDDDTAIQKANIATLRDTAVMARTRLEDVDTGRRQMLRDADARLLAKYNLALKQGEAQLKSQGASQAEIDADGRIVKLRAAQAAAKIQAQKDADTHALNQARIARLNAQAARDQRKAKGGGGGGGGGGGALTKFVEQAGQLAPGDPIPPDLVVLGRQAGLKVNQIASEVDKYRGSGAKAVKAGIQTERQLSKEAEAWAKKNNIAPLIKKQDELNAVMEELDTAPHNPLAQALAVEKAVSSARGGAASKQALALALEHLGPKYTSMEDVYRSIRSKEIGEKQMENFIGFMRAQLGQAQGEGKKKFDEYNNFIASQPEGRRAELEAQRGQIFSGLHGFGEGQSPAVRPAPAKANPPPVNAGPTAEQVKQAKALINLPPNDPRRTPEREARARKIISDAAKPIKL